MMILAVILVMYCPPVRPGLASELLVHIYDGSSDSDGVSPSVSGAVGLDLIFGLV
jgi:hypothetical protein